MINVSKQDEQGSKFSLTASRIEDIEETPPARFRDLQYPLWVINADLFVEYDTAEFLPKWLFDVMMLGKDLIFYGEADVVHRIGRDIQRLWRMEKDKDPTTVPFYHVRLPVYSWLSGPVSTSTVCGSEQRVAGISRYICFFRLLRCRCVREALRTAASVIRLYTSHLQLPNYVSYSAGHFEEMQNKNLGVFMPLIHVLWYLDKYPLGSGYSDAVVVVDDTPAMAAKIAMSDLRTKVAFLAVSTIKQKDLAKAVGGALQHAIIMRYMVEADQTEQGPTAAPWDTQEEWLQRGIPLWVLDSNRGHEGHQQVHAAEAVQEDVVTEAPADDTEPVAPAPTLPMQAKVKKIANAIPTQGTAAGKGTPSSSKKHAKRNKKESDKPTESDDDDTDEEEEEEDPEQVLGTQQRRKRAAAAHFDGSPASGKEQPKKKAKTAATASAEFKPPSRSGAQPSRGTVASPSLGSRLSKVAGPKKK